MFFLRSASNQLRESISLDNYLDPNLLRGLEEVHRKYEAAKAELSGTLTGNESVLITNQLHMSNSNLLSDVAAQFTQFRFALCLRPYFDSWVLTLRLIYT